jgi:hypothetical protein
VLSSPLTVCLVMLGRHVPQLEFLAVILGDEPALNAGVSFYQRLLANDHDEAKELVRDYLKTGPREDVYDTMLVPALRATRLSRRRGEISEIDAQSVVGAIRAIVEDLGASQEMAGTAAPEAAGARSKDDAEPAAAIRIFAWPAHDEADRAALEMLRNLLAPARWNMTVTAPGALTSELIDEVAEKRPALVCLAATPPGGLAHARYLCKRLRARCPDIKLVVCRCGLSSRTRSNPAPLLEAGADSVCSTLLETRQWLGSMLPVLAHAQGAADETAPSRRVAPVKTDGRHRGERGPERGMAGRNALP